MRPENADLPTNRLRPARAAVSVLAMVQSSATSCARFAARFWYRRYMTAA
jgi:hypothetical protein